MRWVLVAALGVLVALVATWCTTGSRARRTLGVMLGVCVLLPPWLLPEKPALVRAVWALFAFTTVMRVTDLAQMHWDLPRRIVHVLSVIDSRRLVRRERRFDIAPLAATIAWSITAGAAMFAITIARWPAGVVAVYAAVASLYCGLRFSYSVAGFDTPPLHVAPIFARSVQELWGERWARPISDWLGETLFSFIRATTPRAHGRAPRVLGERCVSRLCDLGRPWFFSRADDGGVHVCLFLVASARDGARTRVERASFLAVWGHVWTVAWMLALAPFFIEPVVRVASAR